MFETTIKCGDLTVEERKHLSKILLDEDITYLHMGFDFTDSENSIVLTYDLNRREKTEGGN